MKKISGDLRLIYKCCTLYYEDQLSQQEIAKILEISRPTVSRLLKEAKEREIVKIEINHQCNSGFHSLEREVEKKFGLKEVIIVGDKNDAYNQKLEIGNATAKYLERTLRNNDHVGVSMGTTIKEIARFVDYNESSNMTFIPLIGGVGQIGIDIHPNQIVMELAKAFKGNIKLLHAPAVLSDKNLKETLKQDKGIKEILEEITKVNVAIVGIGGQTNKDSTMIATGYYDEDDMRRLERQNVAGDICLQFYDIDGNSHQYEFNEKVFGIEINQLKEIDKVIGIAAGDEKITGIIGAMRGKFINVLVTNYSCCIELLQY